MGAGRAGSVTVVCRLLLCAPAPVAAPNRHGDGQRMRGGLAAGQELYYRENGCFSSTGRLISN